MVACMTIYNYLYSDLSVLRRKGKSRQVKERRGKFMIGTPISKRPKKGNFRLLGIIVNHNHPSNGWFAQGL